MNSPDVASHTWVRTSNEFTLNLGRAENTQCASQLHSLWSVTPGWTSFRHMLGSKKNSPQITSSHTQTQHHRILTTWTGFSRSQQPCGHSVFGACPQSLDEPRLQKSAHSQVLQPVVCHSGFCISSRPLVGGGQKMEARCGSRF